MSFIPNTEENRKEMLKLIGVSDFEELLSNIPQEARFQGDLDIPGPLSELEVTRLLKNLSDKNAHIHEYACFLGGGAYDHYIPAVIGHMLSRSEFYTAYTPYQPEVSQGNLQAIYEYQTMIAELTGTDAANASMYDGGSALAEAALLCNNQTRREEILVSKTVHPFYREVIATYCHRSGITLKTIEDKAGLTDVDKLKTLVSNQTAGILIQSPNFFGYLEDIKTAAEIAHEANALLAVSTDPVALGILKPPGQLGADIVTGEGQALGNALNFGGPYLGIFAVKKPLVRKMPGRIAGVTHDDKQRRGFVLTLQTREQHIRREKATSSICTNQQLCALAATVYLALMGKHGVPEVAGHCLQKAHYLAEALVQIPGVDLYQPHPYFKEFVIRTRVDPQIIIDAMYKEKIFAGIHLNRFDYNINDGLLIAVTEKRTKEEMDRYAALLSKYISR